MSARDDALRLGHAVAARYEPAHVRRLARVAPERRAGAVAAKSARFGFLNGRSILARRALGQHVSARVSGTALLPVGMQPDLWMAIAEQERQRMRPSPSRLEQNMQAAQRREVQRTARRGFAAQAAAAGPRGLPRATSRGRLSPAGIDTGPSSASHRMVTEAAFVANPDEVRAAGPMLGKRDQARAIARRSTVGPPSPSTGGGRARRSAQASGPGRQVGATRPGSDPIVASARTTATAELIAPRAMSLPPLRRVADADSVGAAGLPPQWQPLPRPGALARRGALAAQLRRVPRDLPRTMPSVPSVASAPSVMRAPAAATTATTAVDTRALAVAPTIETAAAGGGTIARRATETPTPASPPMPTPSTAAATPAPSMPTRTPAPTTTPRPAPTTSTAPPSDTASWSPSATSLGSVPASLFGPAAPASLLRARALVAAPAHAVFQPGNVRRTLSAMSPRSRRPSTFTAPMASTIDRSFARERTASAPAAVRSAAVAPAFRSVADAVQRLSGVAQPPVVLTHLPITDRPTRP
ncbi:MAG: hypothetical protein QOG30_3083, partial [Acidimicrobiaceae bacterium]